MEIKLNLGNVVNYIYHGDKDPIPNIPLYMVLGTDTGYVLAYGELIHIRWAYFWICDIKVDKIIDRYDIPKDTIHNLTQWRLVTATQELYEYNSVYVLLDCHESICVVNRKFNQRVKDLKHIIYKNTSKLLEELSSQKIQVDKLHYIAQNIVTYI